MRLTKKINDAQYGAYQYVSEGKEPLLMNKVTKKLGMIEDLEEKLGTDLLPFLQKLLMGKHVRVKRQVYIQMEDITPEDQDELYNK